MTRAPVILPLLIGQLLLPCEGIALRAEPASDCLDAVPGDSCHKFVKWALDKGIEKHPDWFPSFKRLDSDEQNFQQVQALLHAHGKAGCSKPCFTATSPPSAEAREMPTTEVQKTPDTEAQATLAEALAAFQDEVPREAAPATPIEEVKPVEAPAAAAQEAAMEAIFEESKPADSLAPAAQKQEARSNLIGNLEAEIKALQAMKDSPALETLRAEKRQLIKNLQTADKLETERKARQVQDLQTADKLQAQLKELEAMDTTPALEILRAEKHTQIEKLLTADTADAEQTTRELQRLEDPAVAAKEAAKFARELFAPTAEEVNPALAQERPRETAEERSPRSDLIDKLEAELNAMDQIHDSPALDTLRAQQRQVINNLQTANKLEAELKARQFKSLQAANKLEAELKALEAIDNTDAPALETLRAQKQALLHNLQAANKSDTEQTTQELQRLQDPEVAAKEITTAASDNIFEPVAGAADRKPWWQRLWREAKAKVKEVVKEEQTDDKAQATPAEAPAVAVEEVPPKVAPATPIEEVKPVEAPAAAAHEAAMEAIFEESKSAEAKPEAVPAAPAEESLAPAAEAKPEAVPAAPAEEAKPAEAFAPAATERIVPGLGDCLDAVQGDRCHEFVTWALGKGLEQHPDWYPSFKRSDSDEQNFKQMQEILYSRKQAGCGKPCSV